MNDRQRGLGAALVSPFQDFSMTTLTIWSSTHAPPRGLHAAADRYNRRIRYLVQRRGRKT
jgi:hypothetical protein